MPEFDGETAVVTGAARGIGREIARTFASEGASVVLADVAAERNEATAAALREDGFDAVATTCDVRSVEATRALADTAVERFGSLDVLVNNAAVFPKDSVVDPDHEAWAETVDVVLTGSFNCTAAAAPHLADGGGSVVNVGSMAGRSVSLAEGPAYTAAKWGLIGLTKHAAVDLGERGVTANVVCPGPVATDLNRERTPEEVREAITDTIPLGRLADPADVAQAVRYLASGAGSYLTGTVVEVDGGDQLLTGRRATLADL